MAKAKGSARSLKALLVMPWGDGCWLRDFALPFPPFPGLSIRLDVYELVTVEEVVVGDLDYDVTCLVNFGAGTRPTRKRLEALGFTEGGYP
jgi:hypothetical protein